MATVVSTQTVNTGTAFTAGAGTNRIIIIAATHESGDARYLTGVTWNGNAVGQALGNAREVSGASRGITSWILKETDITTNDGGTLALTYNTNPANIKVTETTISGANQSYTVSASDYSDGGTGTTATRTVTVPSSGVAIGVVVTNWDTGGNFTWTNATETFDGNNAGTSTARTSVAYNATAGSQGLQASWTDSVGYAMLAVAIADVSGGSSLDPIVMRWQV